MCKKWYAYIPILPLQFVTSSNRCSSSDPHLTDKNTSQMMKNNFFVDNLVITSNSTEELTHLYKECSSRLGEVHFNLQSCNTNGDELKEVMISDDKYIKNGCTLDKELGYKYEAAADKIYLPNK